MKSRKAWVLDNVITLRIKAAMHAMLSSLLMFSYRVTDSEVFAEPVIQA